jgi:hypothetical protein
MIWHHEGCELEQIREEDIKDRNLGHYKISSGQLRGISMETEEEQQKC